MRMQEKSLKKGRKTSDNYYFTYYFTHTNHLIIFPPVIIRIKENNKLRSSNFFIQTNT